MDIITYSATQGPPGFKRFVVHEFWPREPKIKYYDEVTDWLDDCGYDYESAGFSLYFGKEEELIAFLLKFG